LRLHLVEDEPLIAFLLEEVLCEAGHEVRSSSSWEDAMRVVDAAEQEFDALITDVRLGPQQTGWEIARRVRELHPAMPVIYISGYTEGAMAAEGVPGSVLITKPFGAAAILSVLERIDEARIGHLHD
jgi:DNA-binding NtrC family response regulator